MVGTQTLPPDHGVLVALSDRCTNPGAAASDASVVADGIGWHSMGPPRLPC